MPEIKNDNNEQPKGSTEKPDTSNSQDKPDNGILGLDEQEGADEQSEETNQSQESDESSQESKESTETRQEQKTEESEKEEVDPRDKEIEELRSRVAQLQQGQQAEEPEEEPKEKEEKKEKPTAQQVSDTLVGNLSDEDFDRITGSKDEFTNFLSDFGNKIIAKSKESTINDIPDIVSKSFDRQTKLKSERDRFYNENPDLKKYSDYVGYVLNQKQSQDPGKGIRELLEETEQEVRKNLSLNKQAVDRERERLQNQNRRPASPGSGRGANRSPSSDSRSDQQKQIDDILT